MFRHIKNALGWFGSLLLFINMGIVMMVGAVIWFIIVTVPHFIFRLFFPVDPVKRTANKIDSDYLTIRRAMNDAAGQSWRNLVN